MKIFNKVYKIVPTQIFDLLSVENWLNQQEKNGLILVGMTFYNVAVFKTGEDPKGKLYVLPLSDEPKNPELKGTPLEKKGFEFVSKYLGYTKIYRNENADIDMYKDYSSDFDAELKKQHKPALMSFASLGFCLFMLYSLVQVLQSVFSSNSIYSTLEKTSIVALVVTLFFCMVVLVIFFEQHFISSVEDEIKNPRQQKPPSKSVCMTKLSLVTWVLLGVCTIGLVLWWQIVL